MPLVPPTPDDVDAIARFGEDWLRGIEALSLPTLLMASPLPGIAGSIADIRDALLADDPSAARRKVGWWGRLLGKDIEQQARATQLSTDLPWLLVRAREQLDALARHIEDLDRSHAQLSALLGHLHAGIDTATRREPPSAGSDAAYEDASTASRWASRLAHLGKLQVTQQLNLAHLDHQRRHLRQLLSRYHDTLQQLAPLAAQQAMLRDGQRQQVAAGQARRALAAIEQLLAGTSAAVASRDLPGADTAAADASTPNHRSTLPPTDARNEHEH